VLEIVGISQNATHRMAVLIEPSGTCKIR